MSADNETLLRVQNLSRHYDTVPALKDVSFSLTSGEVLGVVGQRGAGKTTLFSLLSGVQVPSAGEIFYDGASVVFKSTIQAQRAGIAAVYQSPELLDDASVLHNIFLGRELRRFFGLLPQEGKMVEKARALLTSFEAAPELVERNAGNLTGEQRQVVALARALSRPARLLLLDDALEALSFGRQKILLNRVKELSAQDTAVILSSDDLRHIFDVTDYILVLFRGRQVALERTSAITPRDVVKLIVGSDRQERVTPVIWAFENYHEAQQKVEELRQAELELRQSLEERDSLNRQLVERLDKQLKALDRLNMALQEAGRRVMMEREAERKALARELHDRVIQDLLSYNYQLEEIEAEIAGEVQRDRLAKIRNSIRQVVGSLRQVCSDLRPPTIDNHGLSAAIRSLARQWSEQTGIPVALDIDPGLGRLSETIELSVFRIVQEGLSNVRKHATASQVTLGLYRTPKASLLVRLTDDGLGMEASSFELATLAEQKHFGLVGISERVSLLDGTLEFKTPQNGGLELEIEIPSPYPSIRN